MAFTQLDRIAQKPMNGLSKGMRQRLCLSRTLIHNPSVLILDEPAAGLDPRARIELRDMIVALGEMGKTLLISSHILSELAEVCHRVGIIEQGQLLAVGTVDEILQGKIGQRTDEKNQSESGPSVMITVVGDVSACVECLASKRGVEPKETTATTVSIPCSSKPQDQADLLAELVRAGIPVASFQVKQRSLEEAFLHVTQGRVQ